MSDSRQVLKSTSHSRVEKPGNIERINGGVSGVRVGGGMETLLHIDHIVVQVFALTYTVDDCWLSV